MGRARPIGTSSASEDHGRRSSPATCLSVSAAYKSIPALYDSEPGPTARRVGAYLLWTAFAATGVTSSMFLTANAANLFAVSLMRETAGIDVGWVEWFTGFLPVGGVLFLSLAILVYVVYPPGLAISREVPVCARRELEWMGPMSRREILMAGVGRLAEPIADELVARAHEGAVVTRPESRVR